LFDARFRYWGVGASALVAREATRDDDTLLVDCLECVSCTKISYLVIIVVCIYVCLFFLGAALGKISEHTASCTRYGAGRG
jgi:hypothetical protein